MLVGRRRELGELAALLKSATPGMLLGEAGIGKSALLRAASNRDPRWAFRGVCLSGLTWYSYVAISRAIGAEPPAGDAGHVANWLVREIDDGLLVLDDLQWADAETLALLPHLVERIALLGAIRLGDPGTDAAVAACSNAGFRAVEVGPIPNEDAQKIVAAVRSGLTRETIDRIVAEASGSPLLLEELAHGNGLLALRLGLRARLSRCSSAAQRTMAVLGALGRPADPGLAGGGLAELRAAGLLAPGELAAPRHALLGEIAAALVPERERRRIHAELAARIGEPGEAARHHLAAGSIEAAHAEALTAARATTRAGDRARHLELAATTASGPSADTLRLEAATALVEIGAADDAEPLLDRVASSKPTDRACVHLLRARCRAVSAFDDVWEAELRAGLALVAGTSTPVETLIRIDLVERPAWDCDAGEALSRATEALELARKTGTALARATSKVAQALFLEEPARCEPYAREAVRLAAETGEAEVELFSRSLLYMNTPQLYRRVPTAAEGESLIARANELGLATWEAQGRWLAMDSAGAAEGASADLADAYATLLASGPFLSRDQAVAEFPLVLADLGRDEEAREYLARAPAAGSDWTKSRRAIVTAEVHWLAGRLEAALQAAAPVAESGGLFGSRALARVLSSLALLELGLPVPPPFDDEDAVERFTAPLCAGLHLLSQAGGEGRAERLFDEASLLQPGCRARERWRCLWLAGEAARRAGAARRARRRLLEVEAEVADREMLPLLRRVRRSLRLLGERPARTTPAAEDGLTPREHEVLDLIGSGLSSRQVAERLALSAATIDSHVRSIRSKLGVRTRLEAVAVARDSAAADRL